jgi:hypothetical protein
MCDKKLHQECCDQKVIAKNNLDTPRDPDGNLVAVCTKTCWKALEKSMTKGLRLLWGRDGKNGENDPNSSEAILLNWLTEADNYNRYRGKGNEGETKIEFCQDVANIINAAGVVKNRSADDVKKKIETLEKQMRKAAEWASQTGAGLMESGNQTAFRDYITKICEHYYILEPVWGDRVGLLPEQTSDSIFDENGAIVVHIRDPVAESVGEANRLVMLDMEQGLDDEGSVAPPGNSTPNGNTQISTSNDVMNSPVARLTAMQLNGNEESDSEASATGSAQRSASSGRSSSKKRGAADHFNALEKYQQIQATVKERQLKLREEEIQLKRCKIELQEKHNEEQRLLKLEENQIKRMEVEQMRDRQTIEKERSEIKLKAEKNEYKIKLFEQFKAMRDMQATCEKIAEIFPDMIVFFPQDVRAQFAPSTQED